VVEVNPVPHEADIVAPHRAVVRQVKLDAGAPAAHVDLLAADDRVGLQHCPLAPAEVDAVLVADQPVVVDARVRPVDLDPRVAVHHVVPAAADHEAAQLDPAGFDQHRVQPASAAELRQPLPAILTGTSITSDSDIPRPRR